MKKHKLFAALAALTLTFGFAACSSDDDDNNTSGKSEPSASAEKTYTEASDEEKALFTVTYDAEKLAALSHLEHTLADAITITASEPWSIEEYYNGDYDTWAVLSEEKSDATTKITLDIEDNMAEFWAGVTYDENGNPDMTNAELPEDRTTVLHILNAAGKQVAAITLKQTGSNFSGDLVTVISTNRQFVGRGYDIFAGRWANLADVKNSVIIDQKKMAKKGYDIEFQKDARATYSVHTGSTLKELTESFNINASVSTKVFKFSGEVKASYGSNYKETGSEEYGIYSYNARLGSYKLDTSEVIDCAVTTNSDGSFKNNYLTQGAYGAIYGTDKRYAGDAGIKRLIEAYGTHVICSGAMGGRCDYTMRVQKSEISKDYSVEGYLKAGYKGMFNSVQVEVDTKYETKMKKSSSSFSAVKNSIGGSPDLTLSEEKWIGTLNEETATLMEFEPASLRPIWDLCLDPERAAAIKRVVTAYGESFGN